MLYYARIYATVDHFRLVERRVICDKIAGQFYLSREEYIAQRQVWCKQDCWDALAGIWSDPDFKKKSETNRLNRRSRKFKTHKGGSNSIAAIRQKLSIKKGREVSQVEAWIYTHRGQNIEDPDSLNTEEASACLERYKLKAMELNGPDFDWLHSSVDVRALYACSCGRPHGKWAIFNGTIDDREALAELKKSDNAPYVAAAKRQNQEEIERLIQDGLVAKEYAESMVEWTKLVQHHNESMRKFLESVAARTGICPSEVPSALPPPPPPPMYHAPHSAENVGTFASGNGVETPDETLSRIARGVYGVPGTASGGGNYSPPTDDIEMV